MIYYCDRNNLYTCQYQCHHQPQLQQQYWLIGIAALQTSWNQPDIFRHFVYCRFLLQFVKPFSKRKYKWWRFINLEICQNLWLFLKNVTRSLSVCSLVHSQYVTAVPRSPHYTPAMITLLRPSPLLNIFYSFFKILRRDVGTRRECPVHIVLAGPRRLFDCK